MAKVERRAKAYSTRIRVTDAVTGKRSQKRVTARTRAELRDAVARVQAQSADGRYVKPDDTPLGEYLTRWLARSGDGDATIATRAGSLALHITGDPERQIAPDPIAAIPLGKLRHAHLQDWVDARRGQYEPGTLWQYFALIRRSLRDAVRRQVIATSPAEHVELPPLADPTHTILERRHVRALLDHTADDPKWSAFWVLSLTIGTRRGELLALTWADVDLAAGKLRIERTLTRDRQHRWVIGDMTKTPWSKRTLNLPASCVAALRAHRARQNERRLGLGEDWGGTDAVFDDGTGRRIPDPAVVNRALDRALREINRTRPDDPLPRPRVHDLRHTCATHLLYSGLPIPAVSRVLGHKNAAITMRVYAHALAEMDTQMAFKIETLYDDPDELSIKPAP